MTPKDLGEWLKTEMLAMGLTQTDLANGTLVTAGTVSKWIGGTLLPSDTAVDRLAKMLHMDPTFIQKKIAHVKQDVVVPALEGSLEDLSFDDCVKEAERLLDGPPSDPFKAYHYIVEAEKQDGDDQEQRAKVKLLKARYYTDLSRFELAYDIIDEAVNLAGISDIVLSRLEINKAIADLNRGCPRDALKSAIYVESELGKRADPKATIFAKNIYGRAIEELHEFGCAEQHEVAIKKHEEAIVLCKRDRKYERQLYLSRAYRARVIAKCGRRDESIRELTEIIDWAFGAKDWQTEGEARAYRVEALLGNGQLDGKVKSDLELLKRIGQDHNDPRLESMANALHAGAAAKTKEILGVSISSEEVDRIRQDAQPAMSQLHPRNPIRRLFMQASEAISSVFLCAIVAIGIVVGCHNGQERPSMSEPSCRTEVVDQKPISGESAEPSC